MNLPIIGLVVFIVVILLIFLLPETKKEKKEDAEIFGDDEFISDPKTGKYLTLEQAEKGFKINSSENTQFNKNFIDKPDEVIKIENYLENINDKYQTFRRKPFKKIIKELGFQKQYTSIKLHELYQLNNFGFVGVISVEYGNFERQGYTASREYQLGIFIRSNLNSKRAQEIIIKHFSESFKTGTIFSSSGITILKLDTHAKLSDLLRIENKMKTLTMEKQN